MLQTSDPKEDGISDETKPVTESIRMLHQTCFGWWKEDKNKSCTGFNGLTTIYILYMLNRSQRQPLTYLV